jgi:hypothetical protein
MPVSESSRRSPNRCWAVEEVENTLATTSSMVSLEGPLVRHGHRLRGQEAGVPQYLVLAAG